MSINEILNNIGMTKYRLAKLSGIPNATLSELCSGKTSIEKCTAETLYKIAKALNVSIESLLQDSMQKKNDDEKMKRMYEYALPEYLQKDLDRYKNGLKNGSSLMDCYWSELYSSINIAEINDNVITHEHAEYLRDKYLRR